MIELEEMKTQSIIIPESVRRNSSVMEQRAEVVAVGAECWADERTPRAKAGDKVIITKLAGYIAQGPKDGQIYRLVNDRDIFCRIEE
jgi:co-chaperonin GroES (HSP10)